MTLADWLEERKCSHVAMESTGIYWKPVWNILETGSFQLILANAQRIKNVPGRKIDVKDAEWIGQLLRSGLIEGSFVPPVEIRNLRDLTRYRKKILQDTTQEKNRIHKVLQDANIKITTYITDIFGVSGRNILECWSYNQHYDKLESDGWPNLLSIAIWSDNEGYGNSTSILSIMTLALLTIELANSCTKPYAPWCQRPATDGGPLCKIHLVHCNNLSLKVKISSIGTLNIFDLCG